MFNMKQIQHNYVNKQYYNQRCVLRKDITLARNHVILFCIHKPTAPPI